MATAGLAEQLPFETAPDNDAAPESAASVYEFPDPKTQKRKSPLPPFLRLRWEKSVPLLENGMVDIDALAMYMHPNPYSAPIPISAGWKYHHLNYPKASYGLEYGPDGKEDVSLRNYRATSWQQVQMRVVSERALHDVHKRYVPHPARETIELALRDFQRLDILGATTLHLNLLRGNRQFQLEKPDVEDSWTNEVPIQDRVSFLEQVRADNARMLVRAEILTPRLVTSALKRMAIRLGNDRFLTDLANRRLASDPVFYPVRVLPHYSLNEKANRLLATEFLAGKRRVPRQTEVDGVELAAA